MGIFEDRNRFTTWPAIFAGATTSPSIDLHGNVPVALKIPASLGATQITFLAAETDSDTFLPVNKEDGSAVTITVSATTAAWVDITNIFPASVGGSVKLVANASITASIGLVSRNVS